MQACLIQLSSILSVGNPLSSLFLSFGISVQADLEICRDGPHALSLTLEWLNFPKETYFCSVGSAAGCHALADKQEAAVASKNNPTSESFTCTTDVPSLSEILPALQGDPADLLQGMSPHCSVSRGSAGMAGSGQSTEALSVPYRSSLGGKSSKAEIQHLTELSHGMEFSCNALNLDARLPLAHKTHSKARSMCAASMPKPASDTLLRDVQSLEASRLRSNKSRHQSKSEVLPDGKDRDPRKEIPKAVQQPVLQHISPHFWEDHTQSPGLNIRQPVTGQRRCTGSLRGEGPRSYLHQLLGEPAPASEIEALTPAGLLRLGMRMLNGEDRYEGEQSREGVDGFGVLTKAQGGCYVGKVIHISLHA